MKTQEELNNIFNTEKLKEIFPEERANEFFDALFGDTDEGAYDIALGFRDVDSKQLRFELLLKERPGHCLACNLTQGLPQVFSRHPIININGVVETIDNILPEEIKCTEWSLGYTEQKGNSLHAIPLTINLEKA